MNVFITGGTSGLGYSLAEVLLFQDHTVAVTGRDLSKLKKSSIENHPKLLTYQVDVRDSFKMKEVIEQYAQKVGQLDLVVANAGRSVGSKIFNSDFSDAREIVDINFIGVMNTFEPAIAIMLNQKQGHLAAISSVAGFIGLPGNSFYCASKAAVSVMCESLSIDLKKHGIFVSCICPGFVDTPLTQKNDHKMPFLMDSTKAAHKIVKSLQNKKALTIFPWQMWVIITLLKYMPRSFYRFIMGIKNLDYRNKA